jgi:hypothetical protein
MPNQYGGVRRKATNNKQKTTGMCRKSIYARTGIYVEIYSFSKQTEQPGIFTQHKKKFRSNPTILVMQLRLQNNVTELHKCVNRDLSYNRRD